MARRSSAPLWLALAGLNGAIGVAAGAAAAHGAAAFGAGFEPTIIETASRYQLLHATALIGVAWLAARRGGWAPAIAGSLFAIGCVLFSGALYAYGGGFVAGAGPAPIGGSALILGWLALAACGWRFDHAAAA